MATQTVWIDGQLYDEPLARVSPFDHALLTGDGVFETLRIYDGVAFAIRRHLDRLAASATGLGLPLRPAAELRAAIEGVVAANGLRDGRLRLTVTGGVAPLGSGRGTAGPTTIVAAAPQSPWPEAELLVTVPWPRNERGALAGLKTVSYAENVIALAWAKERGAGEALFLNLAGNVCEGTGTNMFVGIGGELVTPPLSAGCLAGITRALVLEQADATERDITPEELAAADEVFITGSTREVQPIAAIDGAPVPQAPGPLTKAAADAFAAVIASDLDP